MERGVEEFLDIAKYNEGDGKNIASNEEIVFMKNTIKGVEECLQRKSKVQFKEWLSLFF